MSPPRKRSRDRGARDAPVTLAIDIGGSGLKALLLNPEGRAMTDRVRVDTPRPATPGALLAAVGDLVAPLVGYDRISVGFPGVVLRGIVKTAPNLHPTWQGVALAERISSALKKPARVLNDAGVQGFGAIDGKGLEMVLTLGTGLGSALFYEGTYVPNLELGHHPFRKGKTYEDYLGDAALRHDGKKKWNRNLGRALAQIDPIWNPDRVYLGGGNARHVALELSPHVRIASNTAGLLGGIALWKGRESLELAAGRTGEAAGKRHEARRTGRRALHSMPR